MRADLGNFPDRVSTIRRGCFAPRTTPRAVSRGSSFRRVSAPIKIASTVARSWCASRRAGASVIQCGSRSRLVRRPSRLIPHFAITNGRPVTIHLLNASFSVAHSSASRPERTSRPARRRSSRPRPWCLGFGSMAPMTILLIPLRIIASVHGPVRPRVEHG